MNNHAMSLSHKVIALFVILVWSYNIIFIKQGVEELPPLFMTMLRFCLVAVIVVPFAKVKRAYLPTLLLMSFTFGFLHFSMLFWGLSFTEAGTGAILVQLGTPFALIMASVFLKEKLSRMQVLGVIVSLIGGVVLTGGPKAPTPEALALLLISAFGWAVTNLFAKKAPEIPSLTLAGWISLLAIPQVGLASYFLESNQLVALQHASWRGWGAIVYSAVASSIIAYSLWYWLIGKYEMNKVIPYSLLNPVAAVFFGLLLLGDSLTPVKLIGGSLTVVGIALATMNFRRMPVLSRS